MEYRLAKVAAEFNVSIKSIVNFLRQKGYVVEPKPTTTITHDIYQLLANDMDFLEIQKKFHAINNHIIVKHEFSDSDQLEAKDKELKSAETSTKDLQGNISLNEIFTVNSDLKNSDSAFSKVLHLTRLILYHNFRCS